MKRLFFFILLSSLGIPLIISSHSSAITRGIRVTDEQGISLYLYKDYNALVVGISNYEKWPRLPNPNILCASSCNECDLFLVTPPYNGIAAPSTMNKNPGPRD